MTLVISTVVEIPENGSKDLKKALPTSAHDAPALPSQV